MKVGINGFGRIGRLLFRAGFPHLEVAGINNLGDAHQAAHLLKYDSTHGRAPFDVSFDDKNLIVEGRKIPLSSAKNPAEIPWKDWGVDLVLECTGAFKSKADFAKHLSAGAKKVLVSAPASEADVTLVFGVNHKQYNREKHHIVSNASCTTNCLAPLAQVLMSRFGIEHGLMTTIHSYTNDQQLLDAPHKDLRRARAAGLSMIPTTTGAAKALGEVIPELKGKLDGISIRVPTPNVSLVDLTVRTSKDVTVDSINEAYLEAARTNFKGLLACEEAPLVSQDFNGSPFSATVDLQSTMVVGPRMAKVFAWYDNEMGFSHRMVDMVNYLGEVGL